MKHQVNRRKTSFIAHMDTGIKSILLFNKFIYNLLEFSSSTKAVSASRLSTFSDMTTYRKSIFYTMVNIILVKEKLQNYICYRHIKYRCQLRIVGRLNTIGLQPILLRWGRLIKTDGLVYS